VVTVIAEHVALVHSGRAHPVHLVK
jgi:hypothetical protein